MSQLEQAVTVMPELLLKGRVIVAVRELEHKAAIYAAVSPDVATAYRDAIDSLTRAVAHD